LSQVNLAQSEKGAAAGMHFRIPEVNPSRVIAYGKERFTPFNLPHFTEALSKCIQDLGFVQIWHLSENSMPEYISPPLLHSKLNRRRSPVVEEYLEIAAERDWRGRVNSQDGLLFINDVLRISSVGSRQWAVGSGQGNAAGAVALLEARD
jgi:hypothetical protein